MKQQLIEYCEYNIWANDRMFDAVMVLPESAHKQEIVSSFSSIYDTWLHIWSGQYVWMQRLKDDNISQRPAKTFSGTMDELRAGLQASANEWLDWVKGASEEELEGEFTIEGRSGKTATFVRKNIVMQVMNHGTYHRGQIVTMMRQAGATEIPSTDYMRYAAGE